MASTSERSSCIHRPDRSPAVTLGEADAALYSAKRSGRDQLAIAAGES